MKTIKITESQTQLIGNICKECKNDLMFCFFLHLQLIIIILSIDNPIWKESYDYRDELRKNFLLESKALIGKDFLLALLKKIQPISECWIDTLQSNVI